MLSMAAIKIHHFFVKERRNNGKLRKSICMHLVNFVEIMKSVNSFTKISRPLYVDFMEEKVTMSMN